MIFLFILLLYTPNLMLRYVHKFVLAKKLLKKK